MRAARVPAGLDNDVVSCHLANSVHQEVGNGMTAEIDRKVARCQTVVLNNGLSRMRGDPHVRF